MQYYSQVLKVSAEALGPRIGLQKLPRRERARLMRRHAIIEAGRAVFATKGYHEATLDDVAEAAELGKATLYSYFDSKEALFDSVLEDAFQTMKAIGQTALGRPGSFAERIRMFIAAEMDYFYRNPLSLRLMMSESHQLRGRNPMLHLMPQLLNIVVETIIAAQQRGEVRGTLDPLDLAGMLINMMYGRVMTRIFRRLRADIWPESHSVSNERLERALSVVDPDQIESTVMATADLVYTVFLSGIQTDSACSTFGDLNDRKPS